METKIVAPPERTVAVQPSRELEVPASQTDDSAAKLETAGSIYLSPVVRIDNETQTAVLQYRDPTTGQVLRQFPPKAASDTYAETEKRSHHAEVKAAEVRDEVPVRTATAANAVAQAHAAPKTADNADSSKSVVA